jgi:EAL domain-containing protein (putative c-di-GMP-specific phosphodiesterase class I)
MEITVAVNISVRNLNQTRLAADIPDLLSGYGLPPEALELEVTESFLMSDPRRAMEVLRTLDALGIGIILDDFGTGYSSLAYLKRLPVRQLKIDKSFVLNMTTDEDDATIVSSTIRLARSLGLSVVAEGVENPTTWQRLAEMGCDFAQGYYLSRPLGGDQMTRWLEQQHAERAGHDDQPPRRVLTPVPNPMLPSDEHPINAPASAGTSS